VTSACLMICCTLQNTFLSRLTNDGDDPGFKAILCILEFVEGPSKHQVHISKVMLVFEVILLS